MKLGFNVNTLGPNIHSQPIGLFDFGDSWVLDVDVNLPLTRHQPHLEI